MSEGVRPDENTDKNVDKWILRDVDLFLFLYFILFLETLFAHILTYFWCTYFLSCHVRQANIGFQKTFPVGDELKITLPSEKHLWKISDVPARSGAIEQKLI